MLSLRHRARTRVPKILAFVLVAAASAAPCEVPSDGPVSAFGYDQIPEGVTLELIRLFPPKGLGIVGRFKLSNGSGRILTIEGKRLVADVIVVEPSLSATSMNVFHLTEDMWEAMTQVMRPNEPTNEAIEVPSGRIQYLDIRIPNSPAYFGEKWLVQIVPTVDGKAKYLNSKPFEMITTKHSK